MEGNWELMRVRLRMKGEKSARWMEQNLLKAIE